MITELYVPRPAARDLHGRRARRVTPAPRERDLRHHPPHRARRRDVSGVGARSLRLHRLQPSCRSHAGGDRRGGGHLPRAHRPRDRARRQLLPHVSPLGAPGSGALVLSTDAGVPRRQALIRSGRVVSERVVQTLHSRCSGRTSGVVSRSAGNPSFLFCGLETQVSLYPKRLPRSFFGFTSFFQRFFRVPSGYLSIALRKLRI